MKKTLLHPANSGRIDAVLVEEGSSLVEMALSCLILIPILFGILQLSLGLYCFHYAADAAREATRWAIVRGADCNGNFGAAYCSPTSGVATGATSTDIATYVNTLGYPFAGAVTTSTQWCASSGSTPATWTCSSTAANGVGNQVQVTVSYALPLVIPFVRTNTLNVSSVSSMTIVQ